MERGTYFVLANYNYSEDDYDVIVHSDPHVVLATYYGNGKWDNELLSGEDYKVIPVEYPTIEDFN